MSTEKPDLTNFYRRARHFGHDEALLAKEGRHVTTKTVYSLKEMRDLVGPLDPTHRETRQAAINEARTGRAESVADRVESYLYGTGELTEKEHADSHEGFPVTVTLESTVDYTLPPGETLIGPSASPTVQNYGTLNIPSDSWITVRNTYYTLNVTNLVMQAQRPPT